MKPRLKAWEMHATRWSASPERATEVLKTEGQRAGKVDGNGHISPLQGLARAIGQWPDDPIVQWSSHSWRGSAVRCGN